MSETFSKVEVITGVARRRRFPMDQKLAVVAETMQPGMSISYVARRPLKMCSSPRKNCRLGSSRNCLSCSTISIAARRPSSLAFAACISSIEFPAYLRHAIKRYNTSATSFDHPLQRISEGRVQLDVTGNLAGRGIAANDGPVFFEPKSSELLVA